MSYFFAYLVFDVPIIQSIQFVRHFLTFYEIFITQFNQLIYNYLLFTLFLYRKLLRLFQNRL